MYIVKFLWGFWWGARLGWHISLVERYCSFSSMDKEKAFKHIDKVYSLIINQQIHAECEAEYLEDLKYCRSAIAEFGRNDTFSEAFDGALWFCELPGITANIKRCYQKREV